MYINKHTKFIKTPLLDILIDSVNACRGAGVGIEAFPLREYVLQSIFLRISGAQEQKLKCICWELATNNYSYRYKYLGNVKSLYGEFSTYNQKNKVYKDLIQEITNLKYDFDITKLLWLKEIDNTTLETEFNNKINIEVDRIIKIQKNNGKIITNEIRIKIEKNLYNKFRTNKFEFIKDRIKDIFIENIKYHIINCLESSILSKGDYKHYVLLKKDKNLFNSNNFGGTNDLLLNKLKFVYEEDVIKHRHRCAHNITSYQNNLPSLKKLANVNFIYFNYFYRFTILILIDEIFMKLYEEYIDTIKH